MTSSKYLIWFVPIYFYIFAPKFMVPGIGIVNSGMIGVMSPILLSWTGRLGVLLNSFKPIATIFLILYGMMLFAAFVNQEFGPYGHHYYFLVVPIYLLLGISVGAYWQFKLSFDSFFEKLLKIVLVVGALNSVIIIVSFLFPSFRVGLEGILYQDSGSNINYFTRDNRLRGLAAGGAANQSFFLGSMVVVSIGLFLYKRISLVYALGTALLIVMALPLVGRTGFVAAILGVSILIVGFLLKHILSITVIKSIILVFMLVVCLFFLLPNLVNLLYSEAVFGYSLEFFYDGLTGIRSEGTISVISGMYHLPDSIISLLIGAGNGSGSFASGLSTDPGYMKMFTAVGLLGSLIFYGSLVYMLVRVARISGMQLLVVSLGFVWFLAEFKEPLMLKGYFARSFWILIGAMIAYQRACRIIGLYQSQNALPLHRDKFR